MRDVTRRQVIAFVRQLEAKGLSGKTVREVYTTLRGFFASLAAEDLVDETPCRLAADHLPKGRPADVGDPLTRAEVELLLSSTEIPLARRVFIGIGALGGLRFGEVAALVWGDLDTATRPLWRLWVRRSGKRKTTKTGVVRAVPVHPALAQLLREWKRAGWAEQQFGRSPQLGDLIVPNYTTRRRLEGMEIRQYNQDRNLILFKKELVQLGIRSRRYHDTRHTFTSLAQDGGARMDVVDRISHRAKTREMIGRYTHFSWEALCSAVECIDVDLARGAVVPLKRARSAK